MGDGVKLGVRVWVGVRDGVMGVDVAVRVGVGENGIGDDEGEGSDIWVAGSVTPAGDGVGMLHPTTVRAKNSKRILNVFFFILSSNQP